MSVSAISPTTTVTRPRASLAVAMLGFFVVALDAQIVNVALPEIRNDLGGGLSGLQWIVTGYTLMFRHCNCSPGPSPTGQGPAAPMAWA